MGILNFAGNSLDFAIVIFATIGIQQLFNLVIDRIAVERFYRLAKKRGMEISKKRLGTLGNALKKIFGFILWSFSLLIIFGLLGFDVVKIIAALGAVSIVLTIVWKDTLSDLYYGFLVLLQNNYRIGDYVVVDVDHTGVVEDITFLTVKLRGKDGSLHVIPHSLARMITNKTHGSSVVRIQMTISKSANVENVISHVNELGIALAKEPSWQTVFIEPLSFKSIHSFDENGVHAIFSANVKADKFSMASSECKMRLINLIKRQKMQVIVVG